MEVTPAQALLPALGLGGLPPAPITIDASASLADALALLSQQRILSAPMMTEDGSSCVGSVDVLAILERLLQLKDSTASVSTLLPSQAVYPFFCSNPVLMLVDLFASGLHRVALIDSQYQLLAICSQSDFVRWLHRKLLTRRLPHLQRVTVADCVLPTRIAAVTERATVGEAVEQLLRAAVSSLAVVHSVSGALIADLSASALCACGDPALLHRDLLGYLKQYAPAALEPIRVQGSDALMPVVTSLVMQRRHRAWLVDSEGRPLGVLTLTDVCRLLGTGRRVQPLQANGDVQQSDLWAIPDHFQDVVSEV
jgi:CBS domain-containing protein